MKPITQIKKITQSSVLKVNGLNICKKLANPVLPEAKIKNQMGKCITQVMYA